MITIDKLTMLNIAQQLEARCDPVFMGQEIRKIVDAAPAALPITKATLEEMQREILSYSPCRCRAKDGLVCRRCRLVGV